MDIKQNTTVEQNLDFKTYIGTKKLKAIPMTKASYNFYRGWVTPENENKEEEGYLVEYLDGGKPNDSRHEGYISWSPKDVFEKAYREYGTIEQELTFGQKAVGLIFNHGEGEIFTQINLAKQTCADAIDQMNDLRSRSSLTSSSHSQYYPLGASQERIALATIAIRKLQSAQMDMVKAITWKD